MSLFMCLNMLKYVFHAILLTHHISKQKSPTLFSDPFQKCTICHCFLLCSYQCFNLSFLKLKVFFCSTKNLFKRKIFKSLSFVHDN
jgi:hypothetical protein